MSKDDDSIPSYKVVMIGESSSDKTKLISTIQSSQINSQNRNSKDKMPEVSPGYVSIKVSTLDGDVELQIWDTAGQERFPNLAPMYYRGASAAILCFDVSNPKGFDKIPTFLKMIKEGEKESDTKIKKFLVGNKCDLGIKIPIKIVENFAKENELHLSFVSSKDNKSIESLFYNIATQLHSHDTKVSFDGDIPIKISKLFQLLYDICFEIGKLENVQIKPNDNQINYSFSKQNLLINKLQNIYEIYQNTPSFVRTN